MGQTAASRTLYFGSFYSLEQWERRDLGCKSLKSGARVCPKCRFNCFFYLHTPASRRTRGRTFWKGLFGADRAGSVTESFGAPDGAWQVWAVTSQGYHNVGLWICRCPQAVWDWFVMGSRRMLCGFCGAQHARKQKRNLGSVLPLL